MSEPQKEKGLPRVLYIMGTARSGSTILEILLAASDGVFGAGELTNIIKDGLIEDRYCSCGNRAAECPIWGEVKGKLGIKAGRLEGLSITQREVDWHTGFVRQLTRSLGSDAVEAYVTFNEQLLAAIREVTGADVVVDSSKYAGRALALDRHVGANITVVCLTKSPHGLMRSFRKGNEEEQPPKSALGTLVYYMSITLAVRIACWLLGGKALEVRYEDLLSSPIDVVSQIECASGIDLAETKRCLEGRYLFDTGHIISGNRLRKGRVVRFQDRDVQVRLRGIRQRIAIMMMRAWRWGLRL